MLPVPGEVAAALIGLVVLSGVRVLSAEGWGFGGASITGLRWAADGSWTVTDAGGGADAELGEGNLALPWLTILEFRQPRRRKRYLLLLPDSADRDLRRRLNVRLRLAVLARRDGRTP